MCRALALLSLAGSGLAWAAPGEEVLAPGYGALAFEAPEPGTYELPPIKRAGDGRVLLPSGEPARLHDLYDDRIVVLSFIYSTCSDANGCPLATFVLHRLKKELARDPELADQVRLISLSFDPRNDTPEVMRLYGAGFEREAGEWLFLTTESDRTLQPILEAYGQSIQREYTAGGEEVGRISHVLRVFLIDRAKRIRNVYSVSFLHPDVVLADIRTLLSDGENTGPAAAAERRSGPAPRSAIPAGLPPLPVADGKNADARAALGARLFRDRRLSANGSLSCAHCHIPDQGFTSNAMARAVGMEGESLRRNTASLYNVGYWQRLFVDGREFGLQEAVWDELLDEDKLGNRASGEILARLDAEPGYRRAFAAAFDGAPPTMENVGQAVAAYLRTLVSGSSPFDAWYYGGQEDAVDAAAKRGFELFTGKAGCASCHTVGEDHALFTDQRLHNTGIGWYRSMHGDDLPQRVELAPGRVVEIDTAALAGTEERAFNDLGLYEVTQQAEDRWAFRTPSLRNVALTAPYMHDGSLRTLAAVVDFYDRGGHEHALLDERIRPLGLTDREKADLVAFLQALTGDDVDILAQPPRESGSVASGG